ncbi:hypothetical protein [Bacillus alkalisoli]|uniref:hypothetical protein n=1 Tax=Bacillus alkalisoli TaxID=2011008 RepID=UPI000C24CC84|nr:hypothetical protein [Bacillus alkalisoli]
MNKLLLKLSGTAIAAMLVTGCGVNNGDVPPPEEQPPMEQPGETPPGTENNNMYDEDMDENMDDMDENMDDMDDETNTGS